MNNNNIQSKNEITMTREELIKLAANGDAQPQYRKLASQILGPVSFLDNQYELMQTLKK